VTQWSTSPLLPAWTVAAWQRDFERVGPATSDELRVFYVQTSSLFSDCRVPRARPLSLRNASSLDDYSADDLAWLAEAHGFAGGTRLASLGAGTAAAAGRWVGKLTWHHVLTDYQNICANPSDLWPRWVNGTDRSNDFGAIELIHSEPPARMLHEHAYPIDRPVVQYEQWRALTPQGADECSLVWPHSAAAPMALLVVVGNYFAYARDRPVHGSPVHGCDLKQVLQSRSLSLQQKRAFFDTELSFGTATRGMVGAVRLTITQSTLPFREGHRLGDEELCRPGAPRPTAAPQISGTEHLCRAILSVC